MRGLGPLGGDSAARDSASLCCCSRTRAFLAVGRAAGARPAAAMMVQMASSNTLIQAMVPDAAARARDGGLLDDVHGHGALRRAGSRATAGETDRGAPPTVVLRRRRSASSRQASSWWRLPSLRGEARALIAAQGVRAASRRRRPSPSPPRTCRGLARTPATGGERGAVAAAGRVPAGFAASRSAVAKRGSMSTGTARQLVERLLHRRPHDAEAIAQRLRLRVVALAPAAS